MNQFLEIVDMAFKNHWCVNPFCTTCGTMDFRNALRDLNNSDRSNLVETLSTVDIHELNRFPNWDNAIRIALGEIKKPSDMDTVLRSWLPHLDSNVALADIVLFYFVRRGALFAPMSIEVLYEWRVACISLALKIKDESLLESLVYTLGSEIQNYKDLWYLIEGISDKSQRIKLALQRRDLPINNYKA